MPKKKVDFVPPNVPSQLADSMLVYQVETALFKLTERSLLEAGLSGPQMMLLGMLYWDGRALVPRRMRNTLVVEAQSLTGLIDGLEADALAKRLKHPKDRRKIKVQITPKGRKKYEDASVRMDQTLGSFFRVLTAAERQQLRKALLKLRGAGYGPLGLLHDRAYPPVD